MTTKDRVRQKQSGPAKGADAFGIDRPFKMIACDLQGPVRPSREGHKYLFTTMDYFTRLTSVVLLRTNTSAETTAAFQTCYAAKDVSLCRTDNGAEFVGSEFQGIMTSRNIQHLAAQPNEPTTNSVMERFHRDLNAGVRALLYEANAPRDLFWGDAATYWNMCRNRTVKQKGGQPAYERLTGKPYTRQLPVWGSLVY